LKKYISGYFVIIYKSTKDIKMTKPKPLYERNEEIVIDVKPQETESITTVPLEQPLSEPLSNDQLYSNIKNIFAQEQVIERKDVYFTPAKGVFEFNIDGSIFMPSRTILLQPRKLEELYLKELESIIYNSKEDLDVDKLLPLIILFSHINKNNYPVRIVSGNYRKLLPKVCSVLNYFLNKNFAVIRSIYESFNSMKDTEEEQFKKYNEEQRNRLQ